MLGRAFYPLLALVASLLAGCAASETRSVVSSVDIPASKYSRIAVFVENLSDPEQSAAETIIVSALRNAGVNAVSGKDFLASRAAKLDEKAKARLAQKEFEALLYVTVAEKRTSEELVPNAYFDGNMIQLNMGPLAVRQTPTDLYVVKPDGRVYQPMLVLKTQSELQDTKSAKVVWKGETISSGHARFSNMNLLFSQASQQMIEKMKTDSAV